MNCPDDGSKLRHIATDTSGMKYYQCPTCRQKYDADGTKTYGVAGGRYVGGKLTK